MNPHNPSVPAFLLCAVVLASVSACDFLATEDQDQFLDASGVIVVNGGNFGDQNGSLSSYSPSTGTVIQGASLDGFLQGMVVQGGRAYALVNTFSVGHIQILDAKSLDPVDRLEGLPAPRSMVIVGDTAYVTNFVFGTGGMVVPVSLTTKEVGRPVDTGSVPEGIAAIGERIYVADQGNLGSGHRLFTFDVKTHAVREVDVPCDGPRDLFPSKTGALIILCSGETVYNDDYSAILSRTNGAILFFDPVSETTTDRVDTDAPLGSTNGTIAGYLDDESGQFFAIGGDTNRIYRLDIQTRQLAAVLSLPPADGLIGLSGIAYDRYTEKLYVGRFPRSSGGEYPDFTSAGSVVIIDGAHDVESTFTVGPAPSQIVLLRDQ